MNRLRWVVNPSGYKRSCERCTHPATSLADVLQRGVIGDKSGVTVCEIITRQAGSRPLSYIGELKRVPQSITMAPDHPDDPSRRQWLRCPLKRGDTDSRDCTLIIVARKPSTGPRKRTVFSSWNYWIMEAWMIWSPCIHRNSGCIYRFTAPTTCNGWWIISFSRIVYDEGMRDKPRTRYSCFVSLSQNSKAISVPRQLGRKSRAAFPLLKYQ